MNTQNFRNDTSSESRPRKDARPPFSLSDAGERRREEMRATLHHALSRRVATRRSLQCGLAALAMFGITWLAVRTSPAPSGASPSNMPIARSTPADAPLATDPPAPTASPQQHRPGSAPTAIVAIVRDDPGIIARLSFVVPASHIDSLDDTQLLAELRPIRGDVGLVRVAGRVEVVDASTLRSTRRPTRREQDHGQGNMPNAAHLTSRVNTKATTTAFGMSCL